MDRNDANQGNEDTRAAEAHTQHAQENRDALAEQNRRTEATAGDSANHPIQQTNAGGSGGSGPNTGGVTAVSRTSEDNSQAVANTSSAHDNLEALREQNRRTEETTPDSVRRPISEKGNG